MPGNTLNKQQYHAVTTQQSSIINAGPGTGKTYTLTTRLHHLLNDLKIPSSEILALTFTQKAAHEMKLRLQAYLEASNTKMKMPYVGTLHAWCFWFLKTHHPDWKQQPKQISSEAEQKKIIASIKPHNSRVDDILTDISLWKNGLKISSEQQRICERYQDHLKQLNLCDFDDLLIQTSQLLADKQTVEIPCYKYILIDEYQDLNQIQTDIITRLNQKVFSKHNTQPIISLVGDPYQAIYGFRGASSKYGHALKENLGLQEILLLENYRSGQKVLDASANLFSEKRILKAHQSKASHIFHLQTFNEKNEAYWVSKRVKQLTGQIDVNIRETAEASTDGFINSSEICVLYRTHALAKPLEAQLQKDAIPFQLTGEKSFSEYAEIEKILNLLKLLDPSQTDVIKLTLSNKERKLLTALQQEMQQNLVQAIDAITFSLQLETSADKKSRINKLKTYALAHPGPLNTALEPFLQAIKFVQSTDEYSQSADKVTLSSIHAAKGLEFNTVFLVGFEDLLIPYRLKEHSSVMPFDNQEELRLLYVAITRAKETVYLTSVQQRFLYGETMQQSVSPYESKLHQFVEPLADVYLEKYLKQSQRIKQQKRQLSLL